MKKNKLVILIFIFIIFLIIFFLFFKNKKEQKIISLAVINNTKINLEIANTSAEHYLGLSFRKGLLKDSGMLFIFTKKEIRSFVMRDMNFSLDIVFIDGNEIVDIYKNLPFDTKSQNILYTSSSEVDKVLELPGNFCQENNISIADKISFF